MTVTLYHDEDCEGTPDPKVAINCDGYCYPIKDSPKSVLLEATYNNRSPPGPLNTKDQEKQYSKVHTNGPQVEFFAGQHEDGGDDRCASGKVLKRVTIPKGKNSTCHNFDDAVRSDFSGMIARQLEICPWEAERYRRAMWWELSEHDLEQKYDWTSLAFDEYPGWVKKGLTANDDRDDDAFVPTWEGDAKDSELEALRAMAVDTSEEKDDNPLPDGLLGSFIPPELVKSPEQSYRQSAEMGDESMGGSVPDMLPEGLSLPLGSTGVLRVRDETRLKV